MRTRTEWTWRHNTFTSVASATTDRAEAERVVEAVRAANPGHDVALVARQVSDWEPAEWGRPMDGCRHPGAINIVQLLGRPSFNLGVPAEDGRMIGAAEGTCPDCGARVVTVNIHDPAQPWNVQDGHGGTDHHTAWTPWRGQDLQVVQDPSWTPVEGDQTAAELDADLVRIRAGRGEVQGCTHGGDCQVHPDAQSIHNFDGGE